VTRWTGVAFLTAGLCIGALLAWTSLSPIAAVLVGCALAAWVLLFVVGGAFVISVAIDGRREQRAPGIGDDIHPDGTTGPDPVDAEIDRIAGWRKDGRRG
jgi:hypothetical protein